MNTNVKEIPCIFWTTINKPLDARSYITTVDNLNTELPLKNRYIGQLIFINEVGEFLFFSGGINNNNLLPACIGPITQIQQYSDVSKIHPITRYIGKQVYVISEEKYYIFKTGVLDSNLIPL